MTLGPGIWSWLQSAQQGIPVLESGAEWTTRQGSKQGSMSTLHLTSYEDFNPKDDKNLNRITLFGLALTLLPRPRNFI